MADKKLREDVVNSMAVVAYEALKLNVDPYAMVRRTFIGTPDMVVIEAVTRSEMQVDEEWWQQVERTIDGEAIRKAVVAIAGTAEG